MKTENQITDASAATTARPAIDFRERDERRRSLLEPGAYEVKPLATNRDKCPKCGKSHSAFNNAPSYTDKAGKQFRVAPCGQRFTAIDTVAETGPSFASNIGFGLPSGRYFKVEMTPKHGQSLYAKVRAEFESEAREFAVAHFINRLNKCGGLESTRVREIGQFSAVLSNV